jgi:hypothetical protein
MRPVPCAQCGTFHDPGELEIGFSRPDVIADLDDAARAAMARDSDDLCQHAGRYYVRGVLEVPVLGEDEAFGFGAWAELAKADFETLVRRWDDPDQGDQPPFPARLANALQPFPEDVGVPVDVQLIDPDTRPLLKVHAGPGDLARAVADGVSPATVLGWLMPFLHPED